MDGASVGPVTGYTFSNVTSTDTTFSSFATNWLTTIKVYLTRMGPTSVTFRVTDNVSASAIKALCIMINPVLTVTALEYRVFDCLLFLADRFEQEVSGIYESTWKKWQMQKPKARIPRNRR